MSSMDGSNGHHRSLSEVRHPSQRPRLPSISNFLEGAGRPDLNFRPSYQERSNSTGLQTSPSQLRPPLGPSTSHRGWPPLEEPKSAYQIEHPLLIAGPEHTEAYHDSNRYRRRSSVTLPHMSHIDHEPASSYSIQTSSRDPLGANSQTSAKSVVREEIIPGKGLCYIYDDGTICQKVINGDPVNPKWGTTKAGKPRKRLGQACNTCREKKIKCDPSFPKCSQCQKFGRECRFEAPSRSGQKSPKMRSSGDSPTSTQIFDDYASGRKASPAPTDTSSRSESGPGSTPKSSAIVDDTFVFSSHDLSNSVDAPTPSKRVRLTVSSTDTERPGSRRGNESKNHPSNMFALDVDPFKSNRRLTEEYLNMFFQCINTTTFCLIPQRSFMRWVETERDKPRASKLVLYCMLALGCTFAKNHDRFEHMSIFKAIAVEELKRTLGEFSLPLVQARLIYALLEFQLGEEDKAWDLCGAATRAACAMRLNSEEGIAAKLDEGVTVYGLEQAQVAECMRRTFWGGYIMDRMGGTCLGFVSTLNKADCFLRLPCTDEAYELATIPETPLFDGEIGVVKGPHAAREPQIGTFAYLAQIASLCCDVYTLSTRAKHQASLKRGSHTWTVRSKIEEQLRSWEADYLAYVSWHEVQRSPTRSAHHVKFGGLHIMYHYASMELHRHVHHAALTSREIQAHAEKAHHHACRTLEIAQQLVSRSYKEIQDYDVAARSALSGFAILTAIDIVTAAGLSSDLLESESRTMELIYGSIELLDMLAESWHSAKIQQRLVSDRIQLLFTAVQAGFADKKMSYYVTEPMSRSLGREDDLIYGVDRLQYLTAMGWADQVKSMSDVVEVVVSDKHTYDQHRGR